MRNAGLEEAQAALKIARKNTNHLRYADNTTLMAESEEQLKNLLMKVKEESPFSQGYGFSSGHVWMWDLDCEESWVPKTWCFWTVVLE